jgi:hypothetical protein
MEVLQRTANRGSISTGYDIDNSLKFEADNTEIIYRTNESGTNRKTFTVSVWFKRTELGVTQEVWHGGRNGETTVMGMITYSGFADQLWVDVGGGTGNTGTLYRSASNQVIRDTLAWYHFVLAVDTTQATEANRMKVWLNGVEVTSWEQHEIPAQDFECALESGTDMAWGGFRPNNTELFSGYIAECHYLDGVAKVQTDFGEYDEDSGIWKPKAYAGTYGDNGCYLNFDDSASLGADSSGNGNDFTLNNIAAADQATDTPTNNFCTTNPILRYFTETFTTEGATVVTKNANGWVSPQSTICPASGKWYMEFKFNAVDSRIVGAAPIGGTLWDSATHYGGTVGSNSVGYADTGYLYVNDSGVNSTYGPAYDNSNIIAVALDMNNGYIYWAKDNTWINTADPVAGSGGYALPAGLVEHSIGASVYQQAKQSFANFGGYTTISISTPATDANGYGTFEYAPPSGYYALCTKNLAEFG